MSPKKNKNKMSVKLLVPAEKIKKISNKLAYPALPVNETLTNGFFTVDNKWTVQYWNKAAESILKVAAKDIVGKNLWQKFEGIIPIELYAIDQRTFLKDVPVHFHEYWGEMGAWFDVIPIIAIIRYRFLLKAVITRTPHPITPSSD